MLKKIIYALTAAALLSCGAQELLKNGDFSKELNNWRIQSPEEVSIEEKTAPGGRNALKVVSAKAHYGANYSLNRKNLKPNTDYTLRARIKTEGNARAYILLCRLPKNSRNNSSTRVITGTTGWTDVYCLMNSGDSQLNSMPVITRVIGQGTAWFSDISVIEGNHLPQENMYVNSDFSLRTRYRNVPDNWTGIIQSGIAEPDNYSCELSRAAPPIPGAGVMEVRNAVVRGNLLMRPVPGQKYTFSFYAKNLKPGTQVMIQVRCSTIVKRFKLTDEWQRYVFTDTFHDPWPLLEFRNTRHNDGFLFSAPQLVPGAKAVPWRKPEQTAALFADIKEAVAEITSKRIAGEPEESDWAQANVVPIEHISRGVPAGVVRSRVRLLHDNQFIFVRFDADQNPGILPGDLNQITWNEIGDTFEVFITDTAMDGTYIHYGVNVNGHDYTARNRSREVLGITSKVTRGPAAWRADVKIPLSLFRANKNWRVAFGRCYRHAKHGRFGLDWSLPGSRHNTAKFGILKGISVTPLEALELEKLYGSVDRKALHYEFSGLKPVVIGGKLTAEIVQNGKTIWSSSQTLKQAAGKIVLPEDYRKKMDSYTRISLKVIGADGKNYYQASRVLYLMFSSYARLNHAMMVYPKFNFFTEKDKTVDLPVALDKKKFDRLRITLLDAAGKTAYRAETESDLIIPSEKLAFGTYRIQVEALKNGKVADIRCHESFDKLPFRPEMIRLNRQIGCLADAKGGFIPILYYPNSYEPDRFKNRNRMNAGAKQAGFNGVKYNFYRDNDAMNTAFLKAAGEDNMPNLADMVPLFPSSYYNGFKNKLSGPESEKVMIETVAKFQKFCYGRKGILSYAPYHEPGYYRSGKGIVDSYRVAEILPELRKNDPYRPITGFWAPPHWDANGEPFGSVDGVDYFIVDVYTRNLKKHCDELFRIAKASHAVRRPHGQIFNVANLGTDERECPTPEEYRAEVYAALIAGYRVFFIFVGIPPVRETWEEMKEINRRMPVIAEFLCDEQCRELASVNEENVCYAVFRKGKEIMVMLSGKSNNAKTRFSIDMKKLCGLNTAEGKELFSAEKIQVKNGVLAGMLQPAGSGIWIFKMP